MHGILDRFKVRVVCTTDDPTSTLESHQAIAASDLKTRVYPAFRPDPAFGVDQPVGFNAWCDRLAEVSGIDTESYRGFLDALRQRHDFFHAQGARLSDHGLTSCPNGPCSEEQAAAIFERARSGNGASTEERERFSFAMMVFFGRLDAEKGWTKQMHLGALRATNTRLFKLAGADIGTDSIDDAPQAVALARYFDQLDSEGNLPKFILYNVNPADNYLLAAMIGNFQDGSYRRQDPVRFRLVVPRPEGSHGVADECPEQQRPPRPLRGHADRLPQLPLLLPPRILPPGALQSGGWGHGPG